MTVHPVEVMQEARRRCSKISNCPLAMAVDDLARPVPEALTWTKAMIARDAISLSLHCNPDDCCLRPFLEQIRDSLAPVVEEG